MKKILLLIGLFCPFSALAGLPGTLVTLVDPNGVKMGVAALPVTVSGQVSLLSGTTGTMGYVSNTAYDQTRTYPDHVTWSASTAPAVPLSFNQVADIYAYAFSNTLNARYVTQVPANTSAILSVAPSATETFVFLSPTAGTSTFTLCNTTSFGTPGTIMYGFSNTSANVSLSSTNGTPLTSGTCVTVAVPGTYFHYVNANSCSPTARYDYTAPAQSGTVKPNAPPF